MGSKVIIALDYPDRASALALIDKLSPQQCRLKVGKHMFMRFGPSWVEQLQARGFEVFLDLKFHDIPNTVADACRAAADLGVWMLNVHATGGEQMLLAAREAIDKSSQQPILIAVTVLTSLSTQDCQMLGWDGDCQTVACRLAELSQRCGCDGVVCSALEAAVIKQHTSHDFLCVTPGIRLAESDDDQNRVMTPIRAMEEGADYLVIGRPITQSSDPQQTLAQIDAMLSEFS